MSSLFPYWTNTISKAMGVVVVTAPVLAIGALWYTARTPFVTNLELQYDQPVQFDHRHHNWEQGIDCRYCHTSVEDSASAGMPSTTVCLGCHGQVWNKSPRLEPVRKAFFDQKPIEWVKVHDVPEFVYFNHSIHVRKGVGCVVCHGRVDQMPVVHQGAPMTMSWCLSCHRNPAPFLRPPEFAASMTWAPTKVDAEGHSHGLSADEAQQYGAELMKTLDVKPRTSCDTCHR